MLKNKDYIVPSPNETACLMKEQQMVRRKMRLLQVRQQGQVIAKDVRESVDQKRRLVLQDIASEINKQQNKTQQLQCNQIKEVYSKGLKDVGMAQCCASETAPDQALCEAIFEEKKKIAKKRYCNAINQLHKMKYQKEQENWKKLNLRNLVAEKENIRAKRIAMLPKLHDDSDQETSNEQSRSTSTTYSSVQSSNSTIFVERASKTKNNAYDDAKHAAMTEEERAEDRNHQQMMSDLARQEKAKFRHLAALRQTRMQNEFLSLENQLKVLQKKDAMKRRETVTCIPRVASLDVSLQDLMV